MTAPVAQPTQPTQPTRSTTWTLWFAARPTLPPALRGHTKSGRVKRPEPVLPLSVNERRRLHWSVESRLTDYWRGEATRLAREAGIPACERIRVSAVVYRKVTGQADQLNDAERLKALVDGLKDAGVVPDDTYRHVTHGSVAEAPSGCRGAGVELVVEGA